MRGPERCEERSRQAQREELKRESARPSLSTAPTLLSSGLQAPQAELASHMFLDYAVSQLTCPVRVLPQQGWMSRAIFAPHHCSSGRLKHSLWRKTPAAHPTPLPGNVIMKTSPGRPVLPPWHLSFLVSSRSPSHPPSGPAVDGQWLPVRPWGIKSVWVSRLLLLHRCSFLVFSVKTLESWSCRRLSLVNCTGGLVLRRPPQRGGPDAPQDLNVWILGQGNSGASWA